MGTEAEEDQHERTIACYFPSLLLATLHPFSSPQPRLGLSSAPEIRCRQPVQLVSAWPPSAPREKRASATTRSLLPRWFTARTVCAPPFADWLARRLAGQEAGRCLRRGGRRRLSLSRPGQAHGGRLYRGGQRRERVRRSRHGRLGPQRQREGRRRRLERGGSE